jgi:hypothetical protein
MVRHVFSPLIYGSSSVPRVPIEPEHSSFSGLQHAGTKKSVLKEDTMVNAFSVMRKLFCWIENLNQGGDLGADRAAAFADFFDGRCHNRCSILGMAKFEMHAAANEALLEHGTAPSGTGDRNQDRLGTILRMTGDEGCIFAEHNGGVAVVLSFNLEDAGGGKVIEEDAAFNFRLNDVAIDSIAQIGMGHEYRR